jgi:hypothetical protein
MTAVDSGVLPDAGLTFVALFQPYSFDQTKGSDGRQVPFNGKTSVFIDGQYQTTDTSRPSGIGADTRYKVNALGATAGVVLPARKVSVNVKYFKEFSNESTVEGQSLQIGAGVTF